LNGRHMGVLAPTTPGRSLAPRVVFV
jgi:hypothetical protein